MFINEACSACAHLIFAVRGIMYSLAHEKHDKKRYIRKKKNIICKSFLKTCIEELGDNFISTNIIEYIIFLI